MAERSERAVRRVLQALVLSTSRDGTAPSLRKLCALLGLRSPRGVQLHMQTLRERGHVEQLDDGRWRPTRDGIAEAQRDTSTCIDERDGGCDAMEIVACDGAVA